MNRTRLLTGLLALSLAVIPAVGSAGGHDHGSHASGSHAAAPADSDAAMIAAQLPSYPLDACPISGKKLGGMGDPVNYVYEGRLVRFCCGMCEGKFSQDPAAALAKIDAAIIQEQLPTYALETCPISGKKLGGMGKPYNHVHGTRLVRFCCSHCVAAFEKNPEAAMAEVNAALVEAQKADYPYKTCPVTPDQAIDAMGEPFDILYGTRLVRLCCEKCESKFLEDPEGYVGKLDAMGTE